MDNEQNNLDQIENNWHEIEEDLKMLVFTHTVPIYAKFLDKAIENLFQYRSAYLMAYKETKNDVVTTEDFTGEPVTDVIRSLKEKIKMFERKTLDEKYE